MGSSSLMDIVGSFIVGGALIVMALRLNAQAAESTAIHGGSYILQRNMTALIDILEFEFRKIGYCKDWKKVADPTKSIRIAELNKIRFLTDYPTSGNPYGDGNLDSITYWVGDTSELASTPNPFDRYLYRQVNTGTVEKLNLGLTQFQFNYFDALNDPLPFPIADTRKVYLMQVSVAVQTATPYAQEFIMDSSAYQVFWKQLRLVTKNMKNR
ncbi:MAG: hypothetical protein HW374_794 [Bacteroidetes bacterium]|nr:hypothetical protein [Bacteroidota bacterium]